MNEGFAVDNDQKAPTSPTAQPYSPYAAPVSAAAGFGAKPEKEPTWFLEPFKKFADFSGRARRKEFWSFTGFCFIVAFVVSFAEAILRPELAVHGTFRFSSILNLVILFPGLAVGVRRMHDLGRSGWWQLFPIVNWILAAKPGQPFDNAYGPDPKAAVS